MNDEMPLISVVLPVFNAEKFIKLALESILKQTYTNLEVIVINDGSTDTSELIIKSFFDERIIYVTRENRGLITTLNEGIALAKGLFIARMDADDICHSNRLEEQINYIKQNPDIGVLFTSLEYIDERGQVIRKNVASQSRVVEPVELLFGCPVCHPTALFNLNILSKADIKYDAAYNKAEDFELWTRLVNITNLAILAKPVFQYRIHSGSITSQNNSKQRDVAVGSIKNNLVLNASDNITSCFSVVYNNKQTENSTMRTFKALFIIFLNLNKINARFSRKTFLVKALRIVKNRISTKNVKSLRELVSPK